MHMFILLVFLGSCTKNTDQNLNGRSVEKLNYSKIVYSINNGIKSIAFVIRHSNPPNGNCTCPGCKCPGCPCPLGICFCGGVQKVPQNGLTKEQIEEDYGTAFAEIKNGKLHLIFNQPTSLPDGTIPIDANYIFNENELLLLGIPKDCYVKEGVYFVDFTKSEYGEVDLDLAWL